MSSKTQHSDDPFNVELSLEEIEAAYLLALETADAAEALLPADSIRFGDTQPDTLEPTPTEGQQDPSDLPCKSSVNFSGNGKESHFNPQLESDGEHHSAPHSILDIEELEERVAPRQVVEALLFVGGAPLPAKKIIDVLGGTTSHEQIDETIDELNAIYASENRPYEIRLVEGGYQMTLKGEYEAVRRKVFGQGPKEVKLNQEGLEALAFVAYQQPIERADLEATGKKNAGGLLRQLLRRQLIELQRDAETGVQTYHTTRRFLELFGLSSIDDLPQAVDFNFK